MPDNFVPGLGAKLQLEISASFTDIAQLVSIDGPSWTVGSSPTTHLGSTTATSRPTYPKGGSVSGQILYDPAATTHAALTTLMATPAIKNWKILVTDAATTPNVSTYAFAGFLTGFKPGGMTADDTVVADFEIEVTGAITVTS